MDRRGWGILGAVLVQIAIIIGATAYFQTIVRDGEVMYLAIEPVDPTDLFRGDYVEFRLEAQRVPVSYFEFVGENPQRFDQPTIEEVQDKYPIGSQVWVQFAGYSQLSEYEGPFGDKFSHPQGAALSKESFPQWGTDWGNREDFYYVKATVEGYGEESEFFQQYYLDVTYGIEQYFIPEGTGRNVDFWNKEAVAEVRIGEDGTPVLTQVFLDGNPWP